MHCCHGVQEPVSPPQDRCQPLPAPALSDQHGWSRLAWAAAAAAQGMILSLALNVTDAEGFLRWVLHGIMVGVAVAVALLAGGPLWRDALQGWRQRRVVAAHFFALGICGAFAISFQSTLRGWGPLYYEVVAVLVAIYALGHLLSGRRQREFASLRESFRRRYSRCRVRKEDGTYVECELSAVAPGDYVQVRAGEVCCVDGVVVEGTALVDESSLTGEPFPVVKRPGEEIRASCVVCDADVLIRVQKGLGNRTIDSILASVEAAAQQRSMLQATADRLSALLLPMVLAVAVCSFVVWLWLTNFDTALMRALAVIVVACPCAMGLATPIGIWSALAAFARRGLVAFHGDVVERLAQANAVVFDKTGTLSNPGMVLADWVVAPGEDAATLRQAVQLLQQQHNHPIAQAFRGFRPHNGSMRLRFSEVLAGVGVQGVVELEDGTTMHLQVGNEALLREKWQRQQAMQLRESADARQKPVFTHEIYVLKNDRVAGLARLREIAREDAVQALETLRALGMQVHVLTGDRQEALGRLGLEVEGECCLSPLQKGQRVAHLEQAGNRVLYIGDGINDTVAMSRAFVSVAMGTGTMEAQSQATAVLFGNRLQPLADAVKIARRVVREIEGNMLIAIAYNTIGMLLAAFGLISPIVAAGLMLLSSATVSFRAFRSARSLENEAVSGGSGTPTQGSEPGEQKATCPRLPSSVPQDVVVVPRWIAAVVSLTVLVQPPLLVWLAGMSLVEFGGVAVVLGAVLSLAVWQLLALRPLPRLGAWLAVMLGSGNLGMLVGWCATWGFAPIVRQGICLCGCPNSPFGQGVAFNWSLMDVGMLLGCLPLVFLRRADGSWFWDRVQVGRCGYCLVGMLLGMHGSALLVGGQVFPTAELQFFGNVLAMTCGMLLGMGLMEKVSARMARYIPLPGVS